MNLDDIKEILDLVRQHDLAEFELERDGLKVRIRKAGPATIAVAPAVHVSPPAAAPLAAASGPVSVAAAGPVETDDAGDGVALGVIKSPIVGTFYRSPEPAARAFVEVGDAVKKGDVLCIIEAMKLMNEIESDCEGVVTAIYVENGQAVQFGDRLFAVRLKA